MDWLLWMQTGALTVAIVMLGLSMYYLRRAERNLRELDRLWRKL